MPSPPLPPPSLPAVASPGYGWAPGDASVACDIGFYNPGYNNRKCTRCPGSLTTGNQGTVNLQDCKAGPGYYFLSGKAVACAEGFYKPAIGNVDCTEVRGPAMFGGAGRERLMLLSLHAARAAAPWAWLPCHLPS